MASKVLTAAVLVTCATVVTVGQARRPQNPTLILESLTGHDSFEFYCASCHGSTGKGEHMRTIGLILVAVAGSAILCAQTPSAQPGAGTAAAARGEQVFRTYLEAIQKRAAEH